MVKKTRFRNGNLCTRQNAVAYYNEYIIVYLELEEKTGNSINIYMANFMIKIQKRGYIVVEKKTGSR